MSDLNGILETTRNEAPTTPEPTPEVTGNEAPQTATPEEAEDYPEAVREYLAQNPDHKAIADRLNRDFKSAFTPKLQEAAELRKLTEGLDAATIQGIRQLQQLAQENPAQAAAYLRQQAELLAGYQQQQQEVQENPYDQYVPATDVEALLINKVREFETWKAQQEQQLQSVLLQQEAREVNRTLDTVEQQYGVQLDNNQRGAVWQKAKDTGLSIEDAFFLTHRQALIDNAVRKARDEASSIVTQKAQIVNPAGVAQRGGGPSETPRGFANIFRAELEQLG